MEPNSVLETDKTQTEDYLQSELKNLVVNVPLPQPKPQLLSSGPALTLDPTFTFIISSMPLNAMAFTNHVYLHPVDFETLRGVLILQICKTGHRYIVSPHTNVTIGTLAFNSLQRENIHEKDPSFILGAPVVVSCGLPAIAAFASCVTNQTHTISKPKLSTHVQQVLVGQFFLPYQSLAIQFNKITFIITIRHNNVGPTVFTQLSPFTLHVEEHPFVTWTDD
jgi:hypothetical protein